MNAKDKVIKALIEYCEPPSGEGSDDVNKLVDEFFKAYDGGCAPCNTEAIPNFMKLYELVHTELDV